MTVLAVVMLAVLAQGASPRSTGQVVASPELPVTSALQSDAGRSGLYGWGLGIELPMVGLMTGGGTESRLGLGYTLGAALAWEVVPEVLARLYVSGGETYASRARIRYIEGQTSVAQRPAADWLGVEVGLGAAYLFKSEARAWTPYVGVDMGGRYSGFTYRFADSLADLEAQDPDCVEGDPDCVPGLHEAFGFNINAGARAGVRLRMLSWLLTQAELALTYAPHGDRRVTNTLTRLTVHSPREAYWLVRANFAVRLGL